MHFYISNANSSNIQVLNFKKNNEINIIQEEKVKGEPQPITISNTKKILYIGIKFKNRINTYKILQDKKIKKIHSFDVIGTPNHISLDIEEKFLFCSSFHGNLINIILLDNLGIPKKIIHTINNVPGCHFSCTNIDNTHLISTSLKSDKFYIYKFKEKTFFPETKKKIKLNKKSGPRHLVFHPNKTIIYNINELNGTIDVWKFQKNEFFNIKNIQNISIIPHEYKNPPWSSDIHITKNGNFLYASDRNASIITLFKINIYNGKLILIDYYVTEEQPRSFCISKNEKYLIVLGEKSNSISIYKINNKNGSLLFLHNMIVGSRPIWVASN
ncbi:beta-propeller fold lactonase family protein [Buchnera aphidicola (Kurisakia onigurumii)]|uniref:beta-propeller fold lactonase family protein n=1 Tax=Buchnera aphidicola TaxID=9 RepID=UPI0031B6BA73